MRFPASVVKERLRVFQERLRERGVDAAVLRTMSAFTYFTGTRWLRPTLLVPSEGDPLIFAVRGEEEGLRERTWIDNILSYREGGEAMSMVSGEIRRSGYKIVGMEFGVERDAYIFFYEMFKKLNPRVRVVDVSPITYELRLIKDQYEKEALRKAGLIARKVLEKTMGTVRVGASETEIAGEAYYHAYRMGSENPLIYVNIGPHPRIHGEPFRENIVKEDSLVSVTVNIDYNFYYANATRFVAMKEDSETRRATHCMEKVYQTAIEYTRVGVKPIAVQREIDKVYREHGFLENRIYGYLHGVGLQVEEPPITTIIPSHRVMDLREGMALSFIHAPLILKSKGQIKIEDTFLLNTGGLERLT